MKVSISFGALLFLLACSESDVAPNRSSDPKIAEIQSLLAGSWRTYSISIANDSAKSSFSIPWSPTPVPDSVYRLLDSLTYTDDAVSNITVELNGEEMKVTNQFLVNPASKTTSWAIEIKDDNKDDISFENGYPFLIYERDNTGRTIRIYDVLDLNGTILNDITKREKSLIVSLLYDKDEKKDSKTYKYYQIRFLKTD
jgi:hypothetical protein